MINRKMPPLELKEHIKNLLKEHKSASLATCINGMPRSSPVQYFLGEDLNTYIMSAGGDKFNAIKENPNVCLLVSTEYIDFRRIKGVQIFGVATTSDQDSKVSDEAKKYSLDPAVMQSSNASLRFIKIVPREIVYLNSLEEGDRTKQVLRNNEVIIKEDESLILY